MFYNMLRYTCLDHRVKAHFFWQSQVNRELRVPLLRAPQVRTFKAFSASLK